MPLSFGSANADLAKSSLNRFVALGEKAIGADFQLRVAAYPNLEYLVQAAQMPIIGREPVELFGPHGVQVRQQGKIMNAGEIPITFIETVSGEMLSILRQWVANKEYHTVVMALVSEAYASSVAATTCVLEGCWLASEPIELSVEDSATPLKPTGTLNYNWAGWYGADALAEILTWL